MIEGYPLDNAGEPINTTMAHVGTMALFENAGFTKAADTGSVFDGFPRVLMRLDLRARSPRVWAEVDLSSTRDARRNARHGRFRSRPSEGRVVPISALRPDELIGSPRRTVRS